jgi:hypothetical protein
LKNESCCAKKRISHNIVRKTKNILKKFKFTNHLGGPFDSLHAWTLSLWIFFLHKMYKKLILVYNLWYILQQWMWKNKIIIQVLIWCVSLWQVSKGVDTQRLLGLWPNDENNFNFSNEKDPTLKGTHASSSTCVSIKTKKYVTQ